MAAEYQSFELTLSWTWDFEDSYDAIIESWGLGDCTATYTASGAQIEAEGTRVTFEGAWALSGGDCPEDQTDPSTTIWYDQRDGLAYATFYFAEDLSTVDDWLQHEDLDDIEPLESPTTQHQWYITDMYADFDSATGEATYLLEEETSIEGLIPLYLTYELSVRFSRG